MKEFTIGIIIGVVIGYTIMSVSNWGKLKAFDTLERAYEVRGDLVKAYEDALIGKELLIDALKAKANR